MPAADFVIAQNDTSSSLTSTLKDSASAAVDIQAATVRLRMEPIAGGAATVNAAASNDQVGDGFDGSKGKVSYAWQAADTATAGWYVAKWRVTYSNGKIQTFPNDKPLLVHITREVI